MQQKIFLQRSSKNYHKEFHCKFISSVLLHEIVYYYDGFFDQILEKLISWHGHPCYKKCCKKKITSWFIKYVWVNKNVCQEKVFMNKFVI